MGTYCHFPYDNLKDGSLEQAMAILGDDANWLN